MASSGLEWFRPMWRRVAVTGFCVLWTCWEWFLNGDQFWGMLTLGLVAWSVWIFFINFDKAVGPPGGTRSSDTPPPPPPPSQP